jgi:OmpA-OmpF porin, OOP family
MSSSRKQPFPFKKAARCGLAAALLIAAMPAARAGGPGDVAGYLTTGDSSAVTDAFGECWHTAEWRRGMRFHHCEPSTQVRPVAAPAGETPAAAPELAAAPKPAVTPRPAGSARPAPIRISIDALFDFDSAALKPEGRAALDALAQRIDHAAYRSASITGHADRLGTPGYNLLLSERRAQAVRAYLGTRGVDVARIGAKGVGSSEPATPPKQCDGLGRARLIQCLQPDRYAEIAVVSGALTASAQ